MSDTKSETIDGVVEAWLLIDKRFREDLCEQLLNNPVCQPYGNFFRALDKLNKAHELELAEGECERSEQAK